jgi:hypothetical protein
VIWELGAGYNDSAQDTVPFSIWVADLLVGDLPSRGVPLRMRLPRRNTGPIRSGRSEDPWPLKGTRKSVHSPPPPRQARKPVCESHRRRLLPGIACQTGGTAALRA